MAVRHPCRLSSPNLAITSTLVSQSDLCSDALIDITFTNNGTGPTSAIRKMIQTK